MEIKKLSETTRGAGTFLIYSGSGAGKTYSLSTLPVEDTLIINIEHGLRTLDDLCPDMDVANIETMADMREVVKHIPDYKYIALDSISALANLALKEAKATTKDGRMAYMTMADKVEAIVNYFTKLPQAVILIAQEGRVNPEEAGLFNYSYTVELPGKKFAASLPFLVDFVWPVRVKQLETPEGTITDRRFQTNMDGDGAYLAKSRSQVFDTFEEVNWTNIFNKLNK